MPELVIKYKNKKTLNALINYVKELDSSLEVTVKSKENKVNGVTIIPASPKNTSPDISDIFSRKENSAKELRQRAWQRN